MEVIEFLFLVFLTPLCYMVIAAFFIYLPLSRRRDLDIPKYGSDIDILTTYPLPASERESYFIALMQSEATKFNQGLPYFMFVRPLL